MKSKNQGQRHKVHQDRAAGALFLEQHGVLTRAQAVGLGFSSAQIQYRLDKQDWLAVHRGVYRSASLPRNLKQDIIAACLARKGAVASHHSAAYLLELDGLVAAHDVEVSLPNGSNSHLRRVVVHRVNNLPPCDIAEVSGIPSTNASRTLIDLGAVIDTDVLELAVEDALRRGLTSLPRLEWHLQQLCRRGRPGCAALKRLVKVRGKDVATDSALETRLARLIRSSDLPEPVRQFQVRDLTGLRARIDFAYPAQRVAVEADSFRWHSSRHAWERELERRNGLQKLGWVVVHVTDRDLRRRSREIIADIRQFLDDRGQATLLTGG